MNVQRVYDSLPFSWQGKALETIQNDRRWLESIVRNTAPFSDGWAKARIVQLAYSVPPGAAAEISKETPTYAGLTSETDIVEALHSLCDPKEHPDFYQFVNEAFVVRTLNDWKLRQFSQATSRNFEVYEDRYHRNVFLVTSTAPVSIGVDRVLPPWQHFRPLFNVDELARLMRERGTQRLTLRTHGYSSPAPSFYQGFREEAIALNTPDPATQARTLQDDHFYIGYQWPSEEPVTSPGLWADYWHQLDVVFKFVFALAGIAGVVGTVLYAFLRWIWVPLLGLLGRIPAIARLWEQLNFTSATFSVQWFWIVATVFLLWALVFLLLRIVVYLRDRYRAIHYGAPDLAEFFWRLDAALSCQSSLSSPSATELVVNSPEIQNLNSPISTLRVNLIGHSMGALLQVNMLRILSDRFGKDDQGTLLPDSMQPNDNTVDAIGEHFILDKLILTAPDIPLEFLREGRNNYVRSAMRRCRRIYLMSSDRDVVLRYLSTVSNWFTEPSIQMAGLRLGNVYLKRFRGTGDYRPYIRIMIHSERAVQPTSSYDLFRKFNYLDCSEMKGVNGVPLRLNHWTALPIDLLNIALSLFGIKQVDVHGGFFQTHTRSFQVLKFLLTANFLADEVIKQEIERLVEGTPVRFLPSQPWVMPAVGKE